MITGVWKVMLEVVKKPLATRKYGVSFLLCYAMKGTLSRLHSKAERVLRLVMSDPVLNIGDKFGQGKLISNLEFFSTCCPYSFITLNSSFISFSGHCLLYEFALLLRLLGIVWHWDSGFCLL